MDLFHPIELDYPNLFRTTTIEDTNERSDVKFEVMACIVNMSLISFSAVCINSLALICLTVKVSHLNHLV